MHNNFLKFFSFLSKNRRLRFVSKEYELANKKRLEHKIKLDSRKNKLNFIYDSNCKKLIYTERKVIVFCIFCHQLQLSRIPRQLNKLILLRLKYF